MAAQNLKYYQFSRAKYNVFKNRWTLNKNKILSLVAQSKLVEAPGLALLFLLPPASTDAPLDPDLDLFTDLLLDLLADFLGLLDLEALGLLLLDPLGLLEAFLGLLDLLGLLLSDLSRRGDLERLPLDLLLDLDLDLL